MIEVHKTPERVKFLNRRIIDSNQSILNCELYSINYGTFIVVEPIIFRYLTENEFKNINNYNIGEKIN